jgi:hypothetical protein
MTMPLLTGAGFSVKDYALGGVIQWADLRDDHLFVAPVRRLCQPLQRQ